LVWEEEDVERGARASSASGYDIPTRTGKFLDMTWESIIT